MKAIRFHDYGDADVLRYEDAPMPEIGPDGILIKLHGSSVNPIDWKIRKGVARNRQVNFPAIAGSDAAGIVEKVGAVVSRFKPGDAVVARVDGGYAEYGAAKTDFVGRAPKSISLIHAAGLPIAGCTAWTMLFEQANLKGVQTVLVQGGSGGVGTFAVQLAKIAGFRVIATTSAANKAMVESLGADQVVDYRAGPLSGQIKAVDLIIDTVGGEAQKQLLGLVRKAGQLLSIAGVPDEAVGKELGIEIKAVRGNGTGIKLEELGGLIDAGKLKLIVDREIPLANAAEAHRLSETGRARGKILIKMV